MDSATSATAEQWAVLNPHDTVQVRDGRTFNGGEGGAAKTVAPWPSTVAGALGALLGGEPACVRGPVLARREGDGSWTAYFPAPADLVWLANRDHPQSGTVRRMALSEPDADGLGPVDDLTAEAGPLRSGADATIKDPFGTPLETEAVSGAVSQGALQDYLNGDLAAPGHSTQEWRLHRAVPAQHEERVGIAIDENRRIRHGALYRAGHLRLDTDWAYAASIVPTPGKHRPLTHAAGPVRFGGMSRMADIEPADGLQWPRIPAAFPGGRVLVYAATPAVWPGGWRPPLAAVGDGPVPELVGAVTGRPMPVAIARPARTNQRFHSSKRLFTAVPPGSLYHLQFPNHDDAAAWAQAHHGRALGPSAGARMDTAGFGVILTGVWS